MQSRAEPDYKGFGSGDRKVRLKTLQYELGLENFYADANTLRRRRLAGFIRIEITSINQVICSGKSRDEL